MYPIYPSAGEAEKTKSQAKLIANLVILVFLILGLLLILQHFHFIFVGDIPVIGDWLLEMYERIFGPPHILILHGDDSIGNWVTLRNKLASELIFISEELDVRTAGSELSSLLPRYSLVIVEDCRTMDKAMLINLDDYVKSGGNLIWVGDAGVRGDVMYMGRVLTKQSGWDRDIVCINQKTLKTCNCSELFNATNPGSLDCKFLYDEAERKKVTFSNRLGVSYNGENIEVHEPMMEIVDRSHWVVQGIMRSFPLRNVTRIANIDVNYKAGKLANIIINQSERFPGIVIQDAFGASGIVVYFSYPPEATMEILKPLVERLRY